MDVLLEIEARAEALRRWLREVDAQGEPRIVIVGQKPCLAQPCHSRWILN